MKKIWIPMGSTADTIIPMLQSFDGIDERRMTTKDDLIRLKDALEDGAFLGEWYGDNVVILPEIQAEIEDAHAEVCGLLA